MHVDDQQEQSPQMLIIYQIINSLFVHFYYYQAGIVSYDLDDEQEQSSH